MPNKLAHFAVEAEDVDRARRFYESLFGWRFEPWGPPDFYLIHQAGVHGALQKKQAPPAPSRRGFECSIAVADLASSIATIRESGGKVLGPKVTIPTVGELARFADTEGNEAIVIQYEPERRKELGL